MPKKYIIITILLPLLIIISIYLYPTIKNNNYQKQMQNNISQNTNIKNIEYLNKDNNYYIIKTKEKIIVLDLNYEEVYNLDNNLIEDNNLDLVYRRNNLYYEEKIKKDKTLTYNFYDIETKELAYQIFLGGQNG